MVADTSRTDEIRRRRVRKSSPTGRKTDRRARKVSTRTPPPVLARGPISDTTSRRSGGSKGKSLGGARRRYDVALNAQGAEMRLPTLPRLRVSWRLISIVMVSLLASVIYYFWNSPYYRVDAAEVKGLNLVSSGEINAELGITGKHVFVLDTTSMEQVLLDEFPEFSTVSARVEIPNTVLITVTERLPVLIWFQDGKLTLVDSSGMTFPMRNDMDPGSYPLIEAEGDPPALVGQEEAPEVAPEVALEVPNFEALAEELALDLPASSEAEPLLSPELVENILQMHASAPPDARLIYSPVHGLGWTDSRGWNVYLGDAQDFAMKLLVYEAILGHLEAANTAPTLISVEYVHAPYFRLE